jgi:hypothetical protein
MAAALLTFVQLLRPQISSQEQFLSGDCAFTGGVDADGRITPVNNESLEQKIERAFFAHVKYLALPEANIAKAQEIREMLKSNYPDRQLKLIPVEWLSEVICNLNIIRQEKVCIGEFVAKKAYKYSRATKVQVPILLVLITFLAVLIEPKLWPWFDYRIDHIEVSGNYFKTINAAGHSISESPRYEYSLSDSHYDSTKSNINRFYFAYDIDNDNRDELFFAPKPAGDVYECRLQLYDDNLELIKEQDAYRLTNYPGDKPNCGYDSYNNYNIYEIIPLFIDTVNLVIVTLSVTDYPARMQIMSFNNNAEYISGPYLHTGVKSLHRLTEPIDIDNNGVQELLIGCQNNRYHMTGLLVLEYNRLRGISPPYNNELFTCSGEEKGTHKYYVAFPESELTSKNQVRNSVAKIIYDDISNSYRISVHEGVGAYIGNKVHSTNSICPGINYKLDENLIPEDVLFADHQFQIFNDLLIASGYQNNISQSEILQNLQKNVIVYHGDSIVHHIASGINFNN